MEKFINASDYFGKVGENTLLDASIIGKDISHIFGVYDNAKVVEAGFNEGKESRVQPYIKLSNGRIFTGLDISEVFLKRI